MKNDKLLKLFCIPFISAFLAYSFLVYNVALNCDTIGTFTNGIHGNISALWNLHLGRWGRSILDVLSTYLSYEFVIPFVSFIFTISMISLSNIILFFVFDKLSYKSRIVWAFIASVIPPITELILFYTDIQYFSISFVLVSLSIYFFSKKNYILSTILFAFSSSIYQPFFAYALTLHVIYLIYIAIYDEKFILKEHIKKIIYVIISSFAALLIYFLILYLSFTVFHISTDTISSRTGVFSLNSMLIKFLKMYAIVLIMPFKNYAGANLFILSKITWLLLYIVTFAILLSIIYKNKNDFGKLMYIFILLIILPICMNCIILMQPYTSTRMLFAFFLIIFLIIIFANYYKFSIHRIHFLKLNLYKITMILILFLSINLIYQANGDAYSAYNVTNATKSYVNQLVSSIRNTPGYSIDKKVYFIGNLSYENLKDYNVYYDDKIFNYGSSETNNLLSSWAFIPGIKRLGAFDFVEPSDDEKKEILSSNIYKEMPIYPNYGSIKIINDVVVIKMQHK